MSVDRDKVHVADMVEAVRPALDFSAGLGRDAFMHDRLHAAAVLHTLLVLGEAAKRVSLELKAATPEIAWKRIAGLRDKLIHDYGNVDLATVWNIIQTDLPPLASALARVAAGKGL